MTELTTYLSPRIERSGNITNLSFTSNAIRDVGDVIARELKGLSCHGKGYLLLLSFANVTYLNSVELGTLVGLQKSDPDHRWVADSFQPPSRRNQAIYSVSLGHFSGYLSGRTVW